jgi:hypothetical protein
MVLPRGSEAYTFVVMHHTTLPNSAMTRSNTQIWPTQFLKALREATNEKCEQPMAPMLIVTTVRLRVFETFSFSWQLGQVAKDDINANTGLREYLQSTGAPVK